MSGAGPSKEVVEAMAEPLYAYNKVLVSLISKRIFFCQKVRVMGDGVYKIVGRKFDITDDLQPYLLKKYKV